MVSILCSLSLTNFLCNCVDTQIPHDKSLTLIPYIFENLSPPKIDLALHPIIKIKSSCKTTFLVQCNDIPVFLVHLCVINAAFARKV